MSKAKPKKTKKNEGREGYNNNDKTLSEKRK
jgi:hypothetical protein